MLPQSIPGEAVMADKMNPISPFAKTTIHNIAEQLLTLTNCRDFTLLLGSTSFPIT